MKFFLPVKIGVWAVMLGCWLIMALGAPRSLDADAISYLDIAYSCVAGNWHAIVNGYWSPGYPLLLTLLLKTFQPSPFREPLMMHLLAFFSLAATLAAFEHFLSVFFAVRKTLVESPTEAGKQAISDDTIRLAGYALFFWITVFLTPAYLEQPDILVFCLYLLATSLCLQLTTNRAETWRFVLLGVVLGLAYLVKAVMFPLAFIFLATLLFGKHRWRILPKALLTFVVMVAVSSPFIYALSKSKGRLTYGDVGAVAYRHIMGWDVEADDQRAGANPGCETKLAAAPHLLDYTSKIDLGTYPPWADPSYGYVGGGFRFDLRKQLNRTHVVLREYFDLYTGQLAAVACGFAALLIWSGYYRGFVKNLAYQYVLWFPAVVGLFLYSLMRVEGRMLAGFTIGLFAAGAAALRIENSEGAQRFAKSVSLAVSVILISQIIVGAGHEGLRILGKGKSSEQEVATVLMELGIAPGDRVSYIGYALTDHAWAHLARARIATEIPEEDVSIFWAADGEQRQQALGCLAAGGAKALVARNVPGTAIPMGWKRVGDSDYFVLAITGKNGNY
jgi:hypothetical protein